MPVLKSRLRSTTYHTLTAASTILCKHWSSTVGGFRAPFLGRHKGTAAHRKPPQGAALISMRERRALIGQTAYVHL